MGSNMVRQFVQEHLVTFDSDEVWDFFSNTNRLNFLIDLPAVEKKAMRNQPIPLFQMRARLLPGIHMDWVEYPFEWMKGTRYSVLREYKNGPFVKALLGTEILADEGGTRVRFYGRFMLRWKILWPLLLLIIKWQSQKMLKACKQFCERERKRKALNEHIHSITATPPQKQKLPARVMQFLENYRTSSSDEGALARNFEDHLSHSPSPDLMQMRPLELADKWQQSRDKTVRLFLAATRSGVLRMSWELICPNCRVSKNSVATLTDVTKNIHCEFCEIDYENDLALFTEMRFSVCDGSLAQQKEFCVGSPSKLPHVKLQRLLPSGQSTEIKVLLDKKPCRLRVAGLNHAVKLNPKLTKEAENQESSPLQLSLLPQGWSEKEISGPSGSEFGIEIKNESGQAALLSVEQFEWDNQVLTAAHVTSMPEFRRDFASEVLSPGQFVGMRSLAVLFTDVKNSTALYELVGDALAYGRVKRHFDVLQNIIENHGGSIVKTIGDSVMAVFVSPERAFEAALAIHPAMGEFNDSLKIDPHFVVRVSMHFGPVIAVNANGILDYFGRTVNIAARILSKGQGKDIILSEEVYGEPFMKERMQEHHLSEEEIVTPLKGLGENFRFYRLCRRAYVT